MLSLINKRIAVDPYLYDNKSPTGLLYIPDTAIPRANQGIVKYAAPDCEFVHVGDFVLFSGYTGTTIRLSDESVVIILHEDFISAKVEDIDLEIPGLYLKNRHGIYFTASYEAAIEQVKRKLKVVADENRNKYIIPKPKEEEYDGY